ncbi:receptor-like protein 19 [Amaranthus tricolor]|uniref:receptor-like protein 19 n=1 Tax=Amaranthus tricolor TaxID=29722 RepID=UPI0025835B0C|nr:receptor-like protein 19 [Amaranthus tricolor]
MLRLQVLVLRSNKFKGTILCPENHSVWPQLHILDLASNHFSGRLSDQTFLKFKSMIVQSIDQGPSLDQLLYYSPNTDDYYEDAEELTFKGYTYFSDNAFHGELPKELGNLNALIVLNFSHNSLSGNIPSSFGNLSLIESLDLSCNYLSGKIPPQFANLNFLEYLTYLIISFRERSQQELNFSHSEGNQGLYGPPLTPVRGRQTDPSIPSQGSDWSSKSWLEWMIRGAGVGFPMGISIVILPLLYIKRWREWYYKHLNIVVTKILRKKDNTRGEESNGGRDSKPKTKLKDPT